MTKAKKDGILYRVCRRLVTERSDKGVRGGFEEVCTQLKLDGAFILRTNEIPFLFEMKDLWEPKKTIAGRRILLDYSEAPDWELVNPFSQDDESRFCTIDDTSTAKLGPVTRDFIDSTEIGAFAVCVLFDGDEYVGLAVYFTLDAHEWSEDEKELLKEVSVLVAAEVAAIKREDTQQYLLNESDRIIREANEAKNQFMSNLSHEIRTPINAVVGMMAIMRHNLGSAEVLEECLQRMEKSSRQLMDMINDCVDMTLLNNREMSMNMTWVPLGTVLEGVKNTIEPLARGRKQIFDIDCDESLLLYADSVKLGRILINCLSNSCQHAGDGTNICLTISQEKAGEKDVLTFRIRDEVVGVDEESAKKIFDPFSGGRFRDAARGGLNMTIAKHLVELMNGRIDFFSDGWGTELVATIPVETKGGKSEAEPLIEADGTETADYAEMYIGRRILIAEDNVLMGEILATILGYRGLETETALNGQEAFDMFSEHDPFYYDMILMDIQMPVMDGIESTRAIRESGRPDAGMIPIVALSANAFKEDEDKAQAAGMNMYLRKPVGEKELLGAISSLM